MTSVLAPTLQAARRFPGSPALFSRGQVWNYQQFETDIQAAARRLRALGVQRGVRVALWAGNSPDWAILAHAVGRVGGVLMPLNTRLTDHELEGQARLADLLLASPELAPRAHALLSNTQKVLGIDGSAPGVPTFWETHPDSAPVPETLAVAAPHAILFTSGTSGKPKGVVLTWGNQLASAEASRSLLPLDAHDRWIDCLPLFHVGGLNILYRCALAGSGVILHDRFDPAAVNAAFDDQGATIASLVAATLCRTLEAREAPLPEWVRAILVGGGPVPSELVMRCPQALPTYGMTETCSGVTLVAPGAPNPDRQTAGRPLAGVEIRILGEDGKSVAAGLPGTIAVRGPMVMAGYLEPSQTDAVFREGWFRTGDYGILDDEGRVTVLTRRDDLILSGGENVYPAEVEAALREHPHVRDAAVVAKPDRRWGQVPLAFVVLNVPLDAPDLRAFLATRLARYKVPADFRVLEQLPLLSNGKVDRLRLKALVTEVSAASEEGFQLDATL